MAQQDANRVYIVDGFLFHDKALSQKAAKESEAVHYLRSRTDMENTQNAEMVLELYHEILSQKLFETPIGFSFLKEVQTYLVNTPRIQPASVEPIEVQLQQSSSLTDAGESAQTEQKEREQTKGGSAFTRFWRKISPVLSVGLLAVLFTMFVITALSPNPNILNYKNKLLNEYASWEQDLSQREQLVKEKEKELGLGEWKK